MNPLLALFDLGITDIKMGHSSHFVQNVDVPAALFSEVAIETTVQFDTAEVGNQVSVAARNKSGVTVLPTTTATGTDDTTPALPTDAVANPTAVATKNYVVQSGDWGLSKIAQDFTGNANRWTELLPINPDKTPHKTAGFVFHVGDVIKIPASWVST